MADLITKAEYKTVVGIAQADTSKDTQIDLLIPWVTTAIRNHTERDLGNADVTESRTFQYSGRKGTLDIDDASVITSVVMDGRTLVPNEDYVAQPYLTPVFWWLDLPLLERGRSTAMGFTRNEDIFLGQNSTAPFTVVVTGTFGWGGVTPGDIKMAAAWTLAAWLANPEPWITESIEGYSRTIAIPAQAAELAIPARARDLLDNYFRV